MSFNPDKCKVLRIHHSRNPVLHHYTLHGTLLESVDHHSYLGIELSSNLDWGKHISNIVGKANRALALDVCCFVAAKLNGFTLSAARIMIWSHLITLTVHPALSHIFN